MLIKNITNSTAPKPIGIGNTIIMPGESAEVLDELVYIPETDKNGKKTGKMIVIPAIAALERLNQITYMETRKEEPVKVEEEPDEEETAEVEKPRRGRRKAE